MDFFERQDIARRNTGRLVALFAVAVVLIAASTYVMGLFVAAWIDARQAGADGWRLRPADWRVFVVTVPATLAVILFGSLYKIAQLRGGGHVVAASLGGRLLDHETASPSERRVLNVVEEMAIASGTPVPPVYVMNNERVINAFAAGYGPGDAVIGVSRGCVELLTRDELQGVIGHEFSHILSGDMRLNIRLMGVLHGILVIGMIGYFLIRIAFYAPAAGRRNEKGNAGLLLLGVGVALAIAGWLGTVFGSWIKAAVSRQREYLADASAVQFTRNPAGIRDALRRIGGTRRRGRLATPNAPEASHLFFAQGVEIGLQSVFATHPPLKKRIRAIDRAWDGSFLQSAWPASWDEASAGQGDRPRARPAAGRASPQAFGDVQLAVAMLGTIGSPSTAHVERARELLGSIPDAVTRAAREPYGARAVVLLLLLDPSDLGRRAQLAAVEAADAGVHREMLRLESDLARLGRACRLPLLDLCLPALRRLASAQTQAFVRLVDLFIRADSKISLFEWCVEKIVLDRLETASGRRQPARVAYYALGRLTSQCATVLSALAAAGHDDDQDRSDAFARGAQRLGLPGLAYQPKLAGGLGSVVEALGVLRAVAPRRKRELLEAAMEVIAHDGEVRVQEAELFRAVADVLECPMPPLLAGQALRA